jgi:predicted small lipoprotein YifL
MASVIRIVAVLALVGVGLTACGKKGTLESPELANEKEASADASGDKDDSAKKAKAAKAAEKAENSTFILDPLLR